MRFSPMWPIWADIAEKRAIADKFWRTWIIWKPINPWDRKRIPINIGTPK